MNPEENKPVAYDTEGRPLYYHPQPKADPASIQNVHVVKDNPSSMQIPEEILQKHMNSKKEYPNLNLSEAEYVVTSVRRHPLGLLTI